MKKFFSYALVAVFGSIPLFVFAQTTDGITANLYQGLKNSQVTLLQQQLQSLGFLSSDSVTGYFGPTTKKAVQAFQLSRGVDGTGFVGPLTRKALGGQSTAPSPAISVGAPRSATIDRLTTAIDNVHALLDQTSQKATRRLSHGINVSVSQKYLADAKLKLDEATAKTAIAKAALSAVSNTNLPASSTALKNIQNYITDATRLINNAQSLVNRAAANL